VQAFVDGYHVGLLVTIALLAVGVAVSYVTLRPRPAIAPATTAPTAAPATTAPAVARESAAVGME
jgi:hypothetical protein